MALRWVKTVAFRSKQPPPGTREAKIYHTGFRVPGIEPFRGLAFRAGFRDVLGYLHGKTRKA